MPIIYDLQTATDCTYLFAGLHLYKDADGIAWNMYFELKESDPEHSDSKLAVLVKARTRIPRRFIKIETALKVATELGFNALEVHTDAI